MIRLQQGKGFEQTMQLLVLMHSIATMEDAAKSEGQAPAASGTSQASAKIYKVRNYVMENFRGRIERDAVAKLAGLSANGFSRFFKQHTGMNFTDYVNLVRLEEASRLLQTTDDTVSGIAYSFADSPHRPTSIPCSGIIVG